jgi:D-3-phosphoglycerate dehydrogenase
VFDPEPAVHHPLFDHPHVVLSPHLIGMTRRGEALTFADAARGVVAVLTGQQPAAVANPAWTTAHSCTKGHPPCTWD